MDYKYLISSHVNPVLSGVAKFNYLLSDRLKIPFISINDAHLIKKGPVLLSVKLRDMNLSEINKIYELFLYINEKKIIYDIFFHTFDELEIEHAFVKHSRLVFCGNSEIAKALHKLNKKIVSAWCPPLLDSKSVWSETEFNLFSFGMAHKIQLKYYKTLHNILQKFKKNYCLWISTAFHEKVSFGDFNIISIQLIEIFGNNIRFLGFLSDDAINYFISKIQLFVAFFEKGVRANNTSVLAAMNKGCAVMTNCDEYSPEWMRHGENILDINKIQPENLDLNLLRKIGDKARQDVLKYASWDKLINLFNSNL